MNKNCLIFLMDIEGHPALTDDFADRYRTYALQDIINDRYIDREKCVIASAGATDRTDLEDTECSKNIVLKKQATLDKGWTWLQFYKEDKFSTLEAHLSEIGFELSPNHTTIIYGGTNTSGCVLHSSTFSMNKFLDRGYYCQLYLPLCDDSQIAGITSIDRNQKAYSYVYQYLKKHQLIEKTDILTAYSDLDVIKSNHLYDWVST